MINLYNKNMVDAASSNRLNIQTGSVADFIRDSLWTDTITYGEIARRMGEMKSISRMSAQAVGGAVGHNEVSIIIPCHQVTLPESSVCILLTIRCFKV